jgi:hypothetical protein
MKAKLVKESLLEKFVKDSDTVTNMGITSFKKEYDDEVEEFILDLSENLPSGLEIYMPENECIDLFNKVKRLKFKVKSILWDSDDDRYSDEGEMSDRWYDTHIQKNLDKGWELFHQEDNYDFSEFLLIKHPA